jgi:hypothetical protein
MVASMVATTLSAVMGRWTEVFVLEELKLVPRLADCLVAARAPMTCSLKRALSEPPQL